jgi:pimeloyl-ACP methyl ester carboxylesterase
MGTVLTSKRNKEMQTKLYKFSKLALVLLVIGTVFSCTKEENTSNLSETLFVRHKDADMPAYIHGNATDNTFLIMLHGGPGGIGLSYRGPAFDVIENEFAVVYFDQRGSGMAQGSYSEDGITIDIMAEDVLALVKVLKKKYGNDARFFLMGHSWGGTLGPAALLRDQSDFLGWINVDGSHNTKGLYAAYISNFKRVAAEQIELENDVPYWNEVIDIINSVGTQYSKQDMHTLNSEAFEAEYTLEQNDVINGNVESDYNTVLNYNLLTLFWNMLNTQSILDDELFETIDFTDRLSEITIPSTVMWGSHDMVVPINFAEEAFDNLGSSDKSLLFFQKSGHSPMFSEPDLFANKVLEFMNAHK